MRIQSRISRLERASGIDGPCTECGGGGVDRTVFLDEHDPLPAVDGCRSCGKYNLLEVRYVDEGAVSQHEDRSMPG